MFVRLQRHSQTRRHALSHTNPSVNCLHFVLLPNTLLTLCPPPLQLAYTLPLLSNTLPTHCRHFADPNASKQSQESRQNANKSTKSSKSPKITKDSRNKQKSQNPSKSLKSIENATHFYRPESLTFDTFKNAKIKQIWRKHKFLKTTTKMQVLQRIQNRRIFLISSISGAFPYICHTPHLCGFAEI